MNGQEKASWTLPGQHWNPELLEKQGSCANTLSRNLTIYLSPAAGAPGSMLLRVCHLTNCVFRWQNYLKTLCQKIFKSLVLFCFILACLALFYFSELPLWVSMLCIEAYVSASVMSMSLLAGWQPTLLLAWRSHRWNCLEWRIEVTSSYSLRCSPHCAVSHSVDMDIGLPGLEEL